MQPRRQRPSLALTTDANQLDLWRRLQGPFPGTNRRIGNPDDVRDADLQQRRDDLFAGEHRPAARHSLLAKLLKPLAVDLGHVEVARWIESQHVRQIEFSR